MIDLICRFVDKIEKCFLNLFENIGLKKFVKFYLLHKGIMRYLVFGGFTTLINIIIFYLFKKIFYYSTTISNVIAWFMAVLFAYFTNKFFVFYSQTSKIIEILKEMSRFFSARIFTLIFETVFLNIFIDYYNFNSIIMKIISNIIVIILNFVLSKLYIFKEKGN